MTTGGTGLVMVVDDDEDVRDTMSQALELDGYRPVCASNGREALTLLRDLPAPPDLILLDLMMPDMSGLQFSQHQQQDPHLATIPVLVVTAGAVNKAAEVNCCEVLQKPVSLEALLDAVHRCRGSASGGRDPATDLR